MSDAKIPWQCRWFGHKWTSTSFWTDIVHRSHQCYRCGLSQDDLRRIHLELNGVSKPKDGCHDRATA